MNENIKIVKIEINKKLENSSFLSYKLDKPIVDDSSYFIITLNHNKSKMALTISDINRKMYYRCRKQGMTHEEVMNTIPDMYKEEFLKDLEKTNIESHFGMKPKTLYLLAALVSLLLSIVALLL